MSLFSLPNELLLTIADNLEPRDITLLILTGDRRLYNLLIPYLHRLAGNPPYELGAIFWAAASGNPAVAALLLRVARDILVEEIADETVIFYREPGKPREEFLRFVLQEDQFYFYDLEIEARGLHWAVRNNHYALARLMLDEEKCGVEPDVAVVWDPSTDPTPQTPLITACAGGDVQMVQLLLEKGAAINARDPYHRNRTQLHVAASAGHVDVVKLLLQNRARVECDSGGSTAIDYAGWCGHSDVVRVLLENVSDDFKDGHRRSVLHLAVIHGHDELVRKFIDRGASGDINRGDINRMAALHYAAKSGNPAVVQLLLGEGAEVDIADKLSRTPLHLALQYGCAAVEALLRGGARVHVSDKYKRTPLHLVGRSEEGEEVVGLLLERGAEVEAVDKYGRTPLHMAGHYGREGVWRRLIEGGAKADAVDWKWRRRGEKATGEEMEG